MNIFEAIRAGDLASVRDAIQAEPKCVSARLPAPSSVKSLSDAVNDYREHGDTPDPHGWTPLHLLASLGVNTTPCHADIVEELIAHGADVDARTGLGWTAIHFIAIHGTKESLAVAKCLLRHGANLAATTEYGADWRILWKHGTEILELFSGQDQATAQKGGTGR